ncbi:hypothetical protein DNTS_017256 [Danionella cerebrum]|uniref:Serine/threonine-protein phosphatase 2A 55 kDa regulatory subunit B n=1 Tax=Danionella cerebrum TaxID=2873325 RepID=A0A553R170_9TELE|nr:hypothetical protein DNTS_017256 [Danionella translucida]
MSCRKPMFKKENPVKVKRSRAVLPSSPEAKQTQKRLNEKRGEEEAMIHILKYEVTHFGVVQQVIWVGVYSFAQCKNGLTISQAPLFWKTVLPAILLEILLWLLPSHCLSTQGSDITALAMAGAGGGGNDVQWCFSQVKGAIDDDVAEADIISTVEFNHSGELLATGDKGGRVVIFQQETENKSQPQCRSEYNVYSTFQSHEPEFDYLKSLEIEEKINKIRWLPQKNAAQFLLSTNDKTIKLWKISERDKRPEGYNLKEEDGRYRDTSTITSLRVPVFRPMDLMVEASPRRVFANAHTYHINSISVNSDNETYLSADDLRINLWHLEITDRSFSILPKGPNYLR